MRLSPKLRNLEARKWHIVTRASGLCLRQKPKGEPCAQGDRELGCASVTVGATVRSGLVLGHLPLTSSSPEST